MTYGFELAHGDCIEVMRTMPDNSIDAIVTDPPYELGFMGKGWDKSGVANNVEMWREALRVLKPGGHLLAFSGSRTYHRMTCAIEDAGFEVRDQIMWLYGSGFPKSLDVSKALDKAAGAEREVVQQGARSAARPVVADQSGGKAYRLAGDASITAPATGAARQWQGWGTALKPAHEPICVARKPLVGAVAANVLAHGTGAINVDGCRVGGTVETWPSSRGGNTGRSMAGGEMRASETGDAPAGRWPANIIHDGSDEVLAAFPDAKGQQGPISATAPSEKTSNVYGRMKREASANSDNHGAVGFKMKPGMRRLDEGSAARFFYCAKASKSDRGDSNTHPTVKPTDLMRYLCRLVTPPGGVVLDPFMGSGSTGKAAVLEGFRFIGIDMTPEYVAIARGRIGYAAGADLC